MANQKISELTAIATIDNATDVLPIVDTSATTTKKITLTQVKTSLALNNVDNTSDANKPISSATQTALDAKVTGNTAITGATKTKVTYDAKGLVTAGADATTADIADSTNKRYVTDAQSTVIGNTSGTNTGDNATNSQYSGLAASKQDTLVSGTNIKTLNSVSLLGAGNIVLAATPSGVSGAIQFSDGTAFASDATTFFWDNTNKRLGIGTNSPASPLSIVNTIALSAGATNPRIENIAYTINNSGAQTGTATGIFLNATETALNGQTHNLLDLQVGGVSRFRVDNSGNGTFAGDIQATSGGQIRWSGRTILNSLVDGNLLIRNSAGSGFSLLQLGGTSSSFPAIKRNGTGIDFRLADDSAYCGIYAANIYSSNLISATTMSGPNACFASYRDNAFTTIWATIDNTTAKANFKTAWNQTGLPTIRPATVGDIYIDTAANITANGDKFLAIRQ